MITKEKKIIAFLKTAIFPMKLLVLLTSSILIVFVLGKIAYAFGKSIGKV